MSQQNAEKFIVKLYEDENFFEEFKALKTAKSRQKYASDSGFIFDRDNFSSVFDVTGDITFKADVVSGRLRLTESLSKFIFG